MLSTLQWIHEENICHNDHSDVCSKIDYTDTLEEKK
jgi:hypothetical protein